MRPSAAELAAAVHRSAVAAPVDLSVSVHPTVIPQLLTRRSLPATARERRVERLRAAIQRASTSPARPAASAGRVARHRETLPERRRAPLRPPGRSPLRSGTPEFLGPPRLPRRGRGSGRPGCPRCRVGNRGIPGASGVSGLHRMEPLLEGARTTPRNRPPPRNRRRRPPVRPLSLPRCRLSLTRRTRRKRSAASPASVPSR